jgi:flagellar biosynthesis protein FlhB
MSNAWSAYTRHSSKKIPVSQKIIVTFYHKKNTAMKKLIVALVLAGGVAVIAYASLSDRGYTKQAVDKQQKMEKKEMKKECKRTCLFS